MSDEGRIAIEAANLYEKTYFMQLVGEHADDVEAMVFYV
jgi:hypothetical protein